MPTTFSDLLFALRRGQEELAIAFGAFVLFNAEQDSSGATSLGDDHGLRKDRFVKLTVLSGRLTFGLTCGASWRRPCASIGNLALQLAARTD